MFLLHFSFSAVPDVSEVGAGMGSSAAPVQTWMQSP